MTDRNRDYRNAVRNLADAGNPLAQERLNEWSGQETLPPMPDGFSWNPLPPQEPMVTVQELDALEPLARMIWNEGHDRRTCWGAVVQAAKIAALNTEDGEVDRGMVDMVVELVHSFMSWEAGFGWDKKRVRSSWIALRLMEMTTQKVEIR